MFYNSETIKLFKMSGKMSKLLIFICVTTTFTGHALANLLDTQNTASPNTRDRNSATTNVAFVSNSATDMRFHVVSPAKEEIGDEIGENQTAIEEIKYKFSTEAELEDIENENPSEAEELDMKTAETPIDKKAAEEIKFEFSSEAELRKIGHHPSKIEELDMEAIENPSEVEELDMKTAEKPIDTKAAEEIKFEFCTEAKLREIDHPSKIEELHMDTIEPSLLGAKKTNDKAPENAKYQIYLEDEKPINGEKIKDKRESSYQTKNPINIPEFNELLEGEQPIDFNNYSEGTQILDIEGIEKVERGPRGAPPHRHRHPIFYNINKTNPEHHQKTQTRDNMNIESLKLGDSHGEIVKTPRNETQGFIKSNNQEDLSRVEESDPKKQNRNKITPNNKTSGHNNSTHSEGKHHVHKHHSKNHTTISEGTKSKESFNNTISNSGETGKSVLPLGNNTLRHDEAEPKKEDEDDKPGKGSRLIFYQAYLIFTLLVINY